MKLGVLGGTFDPVHNGHLKIAEHALSELKLDKIIFVPNGRPPHKSTVTATNKDKLEMLKLAVADNEKFVIDNFEIENNDISYLYKTLEYLKEKYKESELYFLAGADNITQISTWKKPYLIFKYATVVFFKRTNFLLDVENLINIYNCKIMICDFEGIDISSSDIKYRISEQKSIKGMVPDDVLFYIYNNGIYNDKILEKLKGYLKEKRFVHSKNVAMEATKLAKHYNADIEKAYFSGLLHDCAKEIDTKTQIELISKYNTFPLFEDELSFDKVIHAPCSAVIAKKDFNISDNDMLQAIRFHTLGSIKMNLLDKIIYIADLISPDRNYKGIEIIRDLAYNNLNKAILKSINNTIDYLGNKRIQKDVLKLKDYLEELT